MEPARSGEGLELGRLGSGHASTRLDEESALLSGQPEDDYLGEDEDNNDADAAGKGPGHGHSAFFDPDTIDEEAAALAAKRAAKRRGAAKNTPAVFLSWLRIDANGESSVVQADKYKLTAKLGIQTRDLRLLDPHFSSPPCILCRDKSVVLNLEYIKAIITTRFMLIVNPDDPNAEKLISTLRARLALSQLQANANQGTLGGSTQNLSDLQQQQGQGQAGPSGHSHGQPGGFKPVQSMPDLTKAVQQQAQQQAQQQQQRQQGAAGGGGLQAAGLGARHGGGGGDEGGVPTPHFELLALEVCLEQLASDFDAALTELESSAYPALDQLADKVTAPRLERERRLKNVLVRLTKRVESIREVVERFLDDDDDMRALHLSTKEERDVGGDASEAPLARASHATEHSVASTNSSTVESEVAEVEMLLETYFMRCDNSYNRLKTLNEYVNDTEDLVGIKLDQHRNQLITTDLLLTALTTSLAFVTCIGGIFGMNLDNTVTMGDAPDLFNFVVISSCVGSLILFMAFVTFVWRNGLLSWS